MKFGVKYLVAMLPAILTVGGWQMAVWAFDYFGCTGDIKHLQPCFAGSFNILPAIGFGLFWCQILAWICVPISGGLLLKVIVNHIKENWKRNQV